MVDSILRYLHNPKWRRQHRWRKAAWNAMSSLGLTGLHALPLHRRWIDIQRRTMPLKNLDPALEGFRLIQISDLHYSPVVWRRYLEQMLLWVNELQPDLVVVTGDLITGGYRFAPRIAEMLAKLDARHGVVCTFGNHDYSWYGRKQVIEGLRRADYLEKCLMNKGLIVLRNQTLTIEAPGSGGRLIIVGLDDEWSGNIDPEKAFAHVNGGLPVICLNHNPANCLELLKYPWQWMLSGHTHGRQTADSRIARRFSGRRLFTHGYYSVHGRHLYVNRGLAYGQRVKDWCRPEVTVFRLTRDRVESDGFSADSGNPPQNPAERPTPPA
ncbi:MAG: metallophosphoesterase [Phycisphaerae bacterium]|nr:metallophosphoesterase [Phycisphaerae bacterium]MDW8261338.1 metallophosphoesterase [Phycisphaerales bacterium]